MGGLEHLGDQHSMSSTRYSGPECLRHASSRFVKLSHRAEYIVVRQLATSANYPYPLYPVPHQ
jgi:hypothetical protein